MKVSKQNFEPVYIVRETAGKAMAPLIVLIHGVGGNEVSMFSFANSLPKEYLVVSLRGPLTLSSGRYGWY